MSKKITLIALNHCWGAQFEPGNPYNMPADNPLPLPWALSAHTARVASDLIERFPGAIIIATGAAQRAAEHATRGSYRRR